MSLSNTATPIYYGRFRDAVLRGDIRVCREIEMEMNRIDKLIANPGIYYDDKAVEGYVKFCENELTLTDGTLTIGNLSFSLADLSKMYFSTSDETATGIQELRVADLDETADIYDLQGRKVAKAQMRKGIYVVKTSNGTYKVNVK